MALLSSSRTTRAQAHEWATRFARLFTQSIYKWVQSPSVFHVGKLDLDRERALQLPVVQRTEWTSAVLRPASSTKVAKVAKDAKETKGTKAAKTSQGAAAKRAKAPTGRVARFTARGAASKSR